MFKLILYLGVAYYFLFTNLWHKVALFERKHVTLPILYISNGKMMNKFREMSLNTEYRTLTQDLSQTSERYWIHICLVRLHEIVIQSVFISTIPIFSAINASKRTKKPITQLSPVTTETVLVGLCVSLYYIQINAGNRVRLIFIFKFLLNQTFAHNFYFIPVCCFFLMQKNVQKWNWIGLTLCKQSITTVFNLYLNISA